MRAWRRVQLRSKHASLLCDKPASIRKTPKALQINRLPVKRETTHPAVLAAVVMQHTATAPTTRVTGSSGIERFPAKRRLQSLQGRKEGKNSMGSESTMWNDSNNVDRKP